MVTDKKEKRHWKKALIAVVVLLLLVLIGLTCWQLWPQETFLERSVRAELGQLDGKSEAEIEAELNRVVEEGNMNISINVNPTFATGDAEGTLQIENSPANLYAQSVSITRDDTQEVIYESGLLEPNYHIQTDRLKVDLDAGNYDCTATFTAYDMVTNEAVGQAAAKITITVIA